MMALTALMLIIEALQCNSRSCGFSSRHPPRILLPSSLHPAETPFTTPTPEPGEPNFEAQFSIGIDSYSGRTYLSGSVKNVGYKHIRECTVTINVDPPITLNMSSIASGQTLNVEKEIALQPSLTIKEYSATITAIAPDGTRKTENIAIPNIYALSAKAFLTVEAINLVKRPDDTVVFSITIKNSGDMTASNGLNVTLAGI